jgi:hypothetical protein
VDERSRFLDLVRRNPVNVAVLEHFGQPGVRFRSPADAIDHFPTTATPVGVAHLP